ncbi:hypothetical protein [Streptomyces sp. NPDC046832]|uniref:hypothetical protein n=1 Tax=Streptomyces sp. NPDC046832 TaxID=3155020 RepID=UPI0033F96C58
MCDECPDRETIGAIARNPAAPVDVLTGLPAREAVAAWDVLAWRAVPDMAAAHPALPVDLIVESCGNPALSSRALSNPGVPAEVMHRCLDTLGVPR